MGINLRYPNITGLSEREQLAQMKSYLHQLVGELQWALNNVSEVASVYTPSGNSSASGSTPTSLTGKTAFDAIKPLIIKSADIVQAYYDQITTKLEGQYVAVSDFGTFVEQTEQKIEQNSTSTTQQFEHIQVIITGHDNDIKSIDGTLKTIGEDVSYQQQAIVTINKGIEDLDGSLASVEGEVIALDTSLQTTKTELQSTVINTKNELSATITNTKETLSSDIDSAKTELSTSINTAKAQLESNINSTKEELSGSIDSAKTELEGDLNNAKEELSTNIDNAKAELSGSIDTAKNELSGDINNAKSELTGMVEEVDDDLQNTKTDVNGRIDDTNGSVAGLGDRLNDANSSIAEVDKDLQDSKEVINESIQGVQESVTGVNALLEDAKAMLNGSIEDLEAYITELQQVIIGVTAYIKSGLLYYTEAEIPVYGIEVGQSVKDEVTGEVVFNKYARFISEKLSFYDNNGNEVAYISDKKLFIRQAEITIALKIGGLIDLVMDNGDVVTKWVGKE